MIWLWATVGATSHESEAVWTVIMKIVVETGMQVVASNDSNGDKEIMTSKTMPSRLAKTIYNKLNSNNFKWSAK